MDSGRFDFSHFDALVIVAGVSGAGKSRSMDVIGDLGFFNIENLPVTLIPEFLNFTKAERSTFTKLVLLPDIRSAQKLSELFSILSSLPLPKERVHLVFVDSSTEVILQRYSETRRPHPSFDPTQHRSLEDAILTERDILSPFRERANLLLDTTTWSIHDLRRELTSFVDSLSLASSAKLRLTFYSFGFKYGTPRDLDLLVDVRFLPNPYFVPHLRDNDGLNDEVASHIAAAPYYGDFMNRYSELLTSLIPHYISSGKAYLNVGVGCTGGKHRSVVVAEELSRRFPSRDLFVGVRHRDKDRA